MLSPRPGLLGGVARQPDPERQEQIAHAGGAIPVLEHSSPAVELSEHGVGQFRHHAGREGQGHERCLGISDLRRNHPRLPASGPDRHPDRECVAASAVQREHGPDVGLPQEHALPEQGHLIPAQGHHVRRLVLRAKPLVRQRHVLAAHPPVGECRLHVVPGPIQGSVGYEDRRSHPQRGVLKIVEGKALPGPGRIQKEGAGRGQRPQGGVAHRDRRSAHGWIVRQILECHDMHPPVLRIRLQVFGVSLFGTQAAHGPGNFGCRQGRPDLPPRSEKALQGVSVQGGLLRRSQELPIRNGHGLGNPLGHIKRDL